MPCRIVSRKIGERHLVGIYNGMLFIRSIYSVIHKFRTIYCNNAESLKANIHWSDSIYCFSCIGTTLLKWLKSKVRLFFII